MKDEISRVSCTIAGFYESSRGKFSEDATFGPKDQIIIAVDSYLSILAPGAPQSLLDVAEFNEWVLHANRSTEFVQMLLMTMPSPRHEYYESANYDDIQLNILSHSNEIIQALGLYSVRADMSLLREMQGYQY